MSERNDLGTRAVEHRVPRCYQRTLHGDGSRVWWGNLFRINHHLGHPLWNGHPYQDSRFDRHPHNNSVWVSHSFSPPPPFVSTNLAVVRVGDGAAAIVAGTAKSVFVDQYTTAASQTAPVYSYPVTGSNACTLSATSSATWLYDQEGIPSLATSGAFLSFPCYSVAAGSSLAADASADGFHAGCWILT